MSNMLSLTPLKTTYTIPRVGISYQYPIYNKQYKREAAYSQHQQTIMTYNTIPNDYYILFVNATDEFRKTIYKCIFCGEVAYHTLAHLFNDQFWETKFFDHHKRTFVLIYKRPSNPLKEPDLLEEPDLLDKPDPLE
ncbi:11188_t:CDS:2, partial [Funneliformis caledonium]